MLFQIPFLRKNGWKYSLKLAWGHPGVRRVGILILPIVFSLASIEINVFVDTRFASQLASGSVAALHYALRVWYLPIGIFGVTISTVLFPLFSKQTALNDVSGLKNYYCVGLKIIFFLMIPTSTLLIVLSKPIIKVLFMRGAFGMMLLRQLLMP